MNAESVFHQVESWLSVHSSSDFTHKERQITRPSLYGYGDNLSTPRLPLMLIGDTEGENLAEMADVRVRGIKCRTLAGQLTSHSPRSTVAGSAWHLIVLVALCLLYGSQVSLAQTAAPLLTEEEAITLAHSANRPTKSTALGIDRAGQSVREAKTGYFPQTSFQATSGYPLSSFNLTIPAGALGTYSGTGPIPSQDTHISDNAKLTGFMVGTVSQPLSQFYATHLSVESARVNQKIAVEQLRSQKQSVVAQVRQTYHQICTLQVQMDSDQTQVDALQEALRTTENSAAQGSALKADVLQAQSSLAQARYSLASDQIALVNTKEQLNDLLGRDIDTEFTVEALASLTEKEMSLTDARAAALKQRPEVRQTQLQEENARLAVKQEKAAYIPDISAQITYLSIQNVSFLPTSFATAGLSLQWKNPWDWGKRHAEIISLRDAARQQKLSTEETSEQVRLDVDQKYRALALSRQMVDAAALARQASAEQLRNVQNQFREHTALLADVLKQAAQDQQQAQSYTHALATYWNARAAFDQAIGRD